MHFLEHLKDRLEENFEVTYAFRDSYNDIKNIIAGFDGWIVNPGADYKVDADLIYNAKKLKIIISPSTGSDHIDLDQCQKNNIYFDCLKGKESIIKNIHASAEFSFTLLMAMLRKLPESLDSAKNGFWREVEDEFRGIELSGKTVGLIGYGRIGKKMAKYCLAFGAKVIITDPNVDVDSKDVKKVDLETLLTSSDIVCIHVHLDESSKNMFGAREFSLMKKDSYFLNTARGGIVDESALIESLRNNHLKAAAVDVISNEQSSDFSNHPMIKHARNNRNLMVSPHIAGLTVDSQEKAALFAIEQLEAYFTSNNSFTQ